MRLNVRSFRLAALAFGSTAALAALVSCAVNPVTGERELALISEDQEVAMGREASGQVASSLGLVEDQELQEYVDGIGQRLAAISERPDLPWQFRVVDDPTPNAFALPGGYIFVTRGMMNLMASEAELAAVLGHEIGHVTARHSVSQMSRAQLAQLGLGLGMILSPELAQLGDLAGTGLQLLFLKYGRDDERQSDELGFRYMLESGYQVAEMADVFRALQSAGELSGASPLPNWLSSHPAEPERIANAQRRAAELASPPADLRVGENEYLSQLDGLVYGPDPRNGFFRDDWFYHPELIFRFRVPSDWQRQNLPQSVQAVSPDQDAAVQLTLVPASSPGEAAQAFFSQQQGLARLGVASREIAGNTAVISEFQAQTQQGAVRGYVSHIAHGGAVYQLVGYAPGGAFDRRARILEDIVTSFEPVTDREILDIQAPRIDIVELPEAMSLTEFARRYPTPISIEQLALINQVSDPNATIPAGRRLKQVVGDEVG
ncbi:MAG: M48 family metalloprotease [Gammaproteobacteria bacterium]|nr:M48 family metalloprotease [Gammaproteobacteria bacterium]